MNNQVLSIEQCKELLALGIDMSKASAVWTAIVDKDYNPINWCPILRNDFTPIEILREKFPLTYKEGNIYYTFTLQDILEITVGTTPQLWRKDGIPTWHIHDYMMKGHFIGTDLMDIAFKYIKWCKQNNYI